MKHLENKKDLTLSSTLRCRVPEKDEGFDYCASMQGNMDQATTFLLTHIIVYEKKYCKRH